MIEVDGHVGRQTRRLADKGRKRSAKLRGFALLVDLRGLAGAFRFLTGRTSTSVPSGIACGLSRTTFPFLILPRTAIIRPSDR